MEEGRNGCLNLSGWGHYFPSQKWRKVKRNDVTAILKTHIMQMLNGWMDLDCLTTWHQLQRLYNLRRKERIRWYSQE